MTIPVCSTPATQDAVKAAKRSPQQTPILPKTDTHPKSSDITTD